MALILSSLGDIGTFGFDDLIDVRAPAEWAEDHLPGAINLPVLDDAERAEVGTIYKQVSPFTARKVGAALVAANAARHLRGPLAEKPGGWRPMVYCWRGGQRSNSFASILSQIGWRVEVLEGGYRTYRRLVVAALNDHPVPSRVVVLDGNTGTAKTEVLARLAARGLQVLDLEGMAQHRGSLFGAMPGGQPSQKAFETRLAMALAALDPARPVVVEAESSKVGDCRIPPQLWKAMTTAPRLVIEAPLAARAAYLVRAYGDMIADPNRLQGVIARLHPVHGAEVVARWQAMAAGGAHEALAGDLMQRHYDPRYARHRARQGAGRMLVAERLDAAALDDLASRIEAALADLPHRPA